MELIEYNVAILLVSCVLHMIVMRNCKKSATTEIEVWVPSIWAKG